jgi:hypothetical protein
MDILTARGLVIFDYDESVLTSELNGIAEAPCQPSFPVG